MDIAIISALVSAIVSFIVAVASWLRGNRELDLKKRELDAVTKKLENDTNTELRKLRTEIQQTYAGLLLEKRLDSYPSLYQHLSSFIKVVEFGSITKRGLEELHTSVDQWDSQHSILFTGRTANIFHEFRIWLTDLSQLSEDDIQKEFASKRKKTALQQRIAQIELALKSDLGIYIVEFANVEKPEFDKYEEVEKAVEQTGTT